jgi:AraC-like DNA-binding protein
VNARTDYSIGATPSACIDVAVGRRSSQLDAWVAKMARVIHCHDSSSMLRALEEVEGPICAFVHINSLLDEVAVTDLRRVMRRFPRAATALIVNDSCDAGTASRICRQAKFDRTIHLGSRDAESEVSAVLSLGCERCIANRINWIVAAASGDPLIIDYFAECLVCTIAVSGIGDIARRLDTSVRTLERRFRNARLPSPRTVFSLCLLARAMEILADPKSKLDRVRRFLPFRSTGALCACSIRHFGTSPRRLIAQGGAGLVLTRIELLINTAFSENLNTANEMLSDGSLSDP